MIQFIALSGISTSTYTTGQATLRSRAMSQLFAAFYNYKCGIKKDYGKDVYEFHENSIVVKIPFNWINKVGDKLGDKTGDISELNNTQIKVLSEIRNNPNVTKPELEKLVGVGKTTIDNAISVLKKKNIIERTGSNKTGYWQVKK